MDFQMVRLAVTRRRRSLWPLHPGRRRPAAVEGRLHTMAARKPKKPPRRRAKRSLLARVRLPARPAGLEPHHLDVIALALIACGILLAGVAYFGWSGGALGSNAVLATKFVFGALGYAVPTALVALGGLVLARELRPPTRPLRTGVVCLTI